MPTKPQEIYTGIEIGTSSIKVAICSVADDYAVTLLGWGEAPSLKVIKGEIKDRDFVLQQIARAIKKATDEAQVDIKDTYITLAIPNRLLDLVETVGKISFEGESLQITEDHLVAANRQAAYQPKDDSLEVDRQYTRFYSINDRILLNPVGNVSTFIEAHKHSIVIHKRQLAAYATTVTDITECPLNTVAFTPMALACAIFQGGPKPPEGYLLIDIGAGITSYCLYTGEDFYTMGQITVGCDHAANDLSIAFALPIHSTQKILRDFANLQCSVIPIGDGRSRLIAADQGIGGTSKNIPASAVEQIVLVRFQELFNIIDRKMENEDAWRWATGGVMLSGGGAQIPKIAELASKVFRKPVTIAHAVNVTGDKEIVSSPANVVPFGLVRFGKQDCCIENENHPKDVGGKLTEIWRALINW